MGITRRAAGAAVLGLMLGCSGELLSTVDRRPVIRVEDIAFEVFNEGVDGSISATVVNEGARELYLGSCGYSLMRQIDSERVSVWHSICTLEDIDVISIMPGESRPVVVDVSAVFGFAAAEEWHAPVAGEYRLHVALADEEGTRPSALTMSEPFSIPES